MYEDIFLSHIFLSADRGQENVRQENINQRSGP